MQSTAMTPANVRESPPSKNQRLSHLHHLCLNCNLCSLRESRNKLVFGDGSPDALIMFIGEAPGDTENKTGLPFTGRSGKLLRDMIRAIEIKPEDYYIANICKCRPPSNRTPVREEIEVCIKFLKKQIEIIRPELLVLLGRTAVKGLFVDQDKTPIDVLRKETKNLCMNYEDRPVLVTYHPSALLRQPWRKIGASEDFKFLQKTYIELAMRRDNLLIEVASERTDPF